MAISIVQSAVVSADNFASSRSLSFSGTPVVGNLVVGFVSRYSGTAAAAITDNQGGSNTYTRRQVNNDNAGKLDSFTGPVVAASGTFTVTYTPPGGEYNSIVLVEVAEANLTTPVDVSGKDAGSSTCNIPDTTVPGIVFCSATGNSGGTSYDANTGWTLLHKFDQGNGGQGIGVIYKMAPTPGAHDPSWIVGGSISFLGMAIAQAMSSVKPGAFYGQQWRR